jgi:uncharacterized protein
MLFLQGTRDALADLQLITELTSELQLSTLKIFHGADHSFAAGKKEVMPELVENTKAWMINL